MKAKKLRGRCICGIKLNNSGMSLVEVIIAMTIFAIVTVPVLHALTSSAYYNQKARKRQNVTALAEGVMENFKGYPIDHLEKEIFSKGKDGAKTFGLEIANDSDIRFEYVEPGKKESAIKFYINNIKSEKSDYNIEIEATPSVKEEEIFEIDNVSTDRDAIFEYDKSYDEDTYDRVKSNFSSKATAINGMLNGDHKLDKDGNEYTVDTLDKDYLKIQKREFLYEIDKDGDDYVVKVSGAYIYQLQKHPCYEKYTGAPSTEESSTEESSTEESSEDSGTIDTEPETSTVPAVGSFVEMPEDKWFQSFVHYMDLLDSTGDHDGYDILTGIPTHDIPIYDSTHDATDDMIISGMSEKEVYRGKNLKRLLIYFFPAYKGDDGYDDGFRDMIKIDNKTSEKFDCYLIKQRIPGMSATKLTINEQGYTPIVSGTGTSDMRLFHNLDENLGRSTGSADNDIKTSEFKKVENYTASDVFKKKKVMAYRLALTVKDKDGNELTKLKGTMYEKYREYGAEEESEPTSE